MYIITLLRHEESIFNLYQNSEKNCSLSENGIKNCSKLSGYYDIIICSPLKRCIQTLIYSNIKYNKLYISNLCREYKEDICDFFETEDIIIEDIKLFMLRLNEFKLLLKKIIEEYKIQNNLIPSILVITHANFMFYFDFNIDLPKNGEKINIIF